MRTLREKLAGAYEALLKAVFLAISIVVVLLALRNSLLWHVDQFWGASGSFFTSVWGVLYAASGKSHFIMHVITSMAVSTAVFFLTNTFFTFLDITGHPRLLYRYKIQEDKNVPVSWAKYKDVFWVVLFNSVVVGLLFNLTMYPLVVWRGMSCSLPLPTLTTTILHLLAFIVVQELIFYYSHRLLHHRLLYARVHKVHHQWTAPVALASIYSHPLEHFLSTLLSSFMGPLLLGSHLAVYLLFISLAVLSVTVAHCGYHLPFLPSPEAHDFHHEKFTNNYGSWGVLDRLHGTDAQFKLSRSHDRHVLLLGLAPVKQLYPDLPKTSACCS